MLNNDEFDYNYDNCLDQTIIYKMISLLGKNLSYYNASHYAAIKIPLINIATNI